ncbi:hypothetical protein Cycma_4775 [Cyclobacterium marinum DSM 745]|uniref:Uncharacterized protein n=1 Tax=Cyclobacterium marinum (strain ATCC 25205 / DSM 745 / LMG 13164 / NCIMB 1802) TaxID=880070 RepID=G0J5L1_CYCMS|nr:hypothetical protein Cycma_4775 [Cyclobacterium marinum DSM 745]
MGIQSFFWVVFLIIFIYLIFRRINIKEREDFEDRDN